MPSSAANIFKTREFQHLGIDYVVVAYIEPTDPNVVRIQVLIDTDPRTPAVITYDDGFRAALVYSVDLFKRIDIKRALGISAVDSLMDTAEHDIKSLLKKPSVEN